MTEKEKVIAMLNRILDAHHFAWKPGHTLLENCELLNLAVRNTQRELMKMYDIKEEDLMPEYPVLIIDPTGRN